MQRTHTAIFVCAFSGVLVLAGAPSIAHLPGAHPPWAIALLIVAGAVHALALSTGLLLACAAARRGALLALTAAVAGLTCTYLATDALAYGLVGVHLGRATWGHLFQPGSLTTLGIGAADAAIAFLTFAVTSALCVAAAGRVSPRLLLRLAAVALVSDLTALAALIELKSSAALNFNLDAAVLPAGRGEVVPTAPNAPPARDEENTRWAEAWARTGRKEPSLAVLFLDQSHWPYAGDPGLSPTGGDAWALRSRTSELHERYIAALQAEDRLVARVLSALREAGRYDDTIIVATGDHGEAFREHGVLSHGSRLDEEQVRVPLILSAPGRGPGVLPGPSVHHDLLPTLLGLVGARGAPPCAVCGIDLLQQGAARASPLTLGSCGISFPTGFAALSRDRKILFQLDDRGARLVGALGPGDAAASASADEPEIRDILDKASHASRELLQPRTLDY